ncbi:MAG: tRNA uridine-5-carboxymethylaminomethyl(34) synthesis enzyme MnmG [Bacteroidales bacterium]|nr:tRNA uridine-5-carboxymethylaminomethyl(34) synthesis enzyme MnmG [Bacteroidales bacterium]MBN2750043.1 tRNA uridine-5-carboxymethylaminomethyl(34) synthesis enzyme MnmG [Bacteroidales bacterium]
MDQSFDVIVVGGGHAGCEAAAAAANLGSKVLLVSMDLSKFAQMSCNPAMGGIGKGQILREIDALGGYSAIVTDKTSIQFRMLNRSKGPAMWSPRAQCDRMLFSAEWRDYLESIPNLFLWQDSVVDLIIEEHAIKGVKTQIGVDFYAKTVILTNGTFLDGKIHIGKTNFAGGRIGEAASYGISATLRNAGFEVGRMKTGTPVRIDGRTVDYSKLVEQPGDEDTSFFSFTTELDNPLSKRSCYTVHTSQAVHDSLRIGFSDSPLFTGIIQGVGPRYCPSIEDKIRTFSTKDSHQLFLEPEGEKTYEMYLNGFSSSLPWNVQMDSLQMISGFESVKILRPGYAIEYDYFQPTQLFHSLETKLVKGLFFAGQINGTTGYEEAAAQGFIAGINAHLAVNSSAPFVLNRDQAYIGVLIDDLVTKGVDEPYRMFTSRAEFRILLRQDNADERLTKMGYTLGLISQERYQKFVQKYQIVDSIEQYIRKTSIDPAVINPFLASLGSAPLSQKRKMIDVLLRPEISIKQLIQVYPEIYSLIPDNYPLKQDLLQIAEIRIKYGGYIEREKVIADKLNRLDHIRINPDFNYSALESLSTEARQKLSRIKPQTIGQARQIPGVSPSDINVLLVYFGR